MLSFYTMNVWKDLASDPSVVQKFAVCTVRCNSKLVNSSFLIFLFLFFWLRINRNATEFADTTSNRRLHELIRNVKSRRMECLAHKIYPLLNWSSVTISCSYSCCRHFVYFCVGLYYFCVWTHFTILFIQNLKAYH